MSKHKVKKTRKFRSLTVTLAIAFLALSAVVLLISSSLNMYSSFRNQRKIINGQQQLIAQNAANTVKSFVQEKFGILEDAVSIGDLSIAAQEKQKLILEKLLGLEPSFRQLVLLNTQKQELLRVSRVSDLATGQLREQNKSELFSQVDQGKTYISSIYINEITSEPLVIMAVPVMDVFGDFKGILMAEVNLKFMWDLVDRIKIGNEGQAYVVDIQGNLIASGDISRVLRGENLIHLKEVTKFVNGKELSTEGKAEISKGIKNTYVVATHVPLGTPDWAVVVELPVLEAYETVTMALIISVLVILLSFALAIVFGIYLSKRITKPIIDLRDATRKISKGNLEIKIESKSKDEIGQLSRAFDRMTINLKRSKNSLEEYSANLMKKVKERTAELDKKVKESERQMVATLNLAEDLEATSIDLKEEITERKQIEEALKISETNVRQIIEQSNDAIYVQQDEKFVLVNPAFKKLVEYSKDELLSPDFEFMNIISKESMEFFIDREISRQRGESLPEKFNLKAVSKSGNLMDFEISTSKIAWNGKPASLGIIRDLTEYYKIQDELVKSEKLDSVGVLAGGIAHDFNNILSVILGNMQLARMKLEDGEDVSKYMKSLEDATTRATGLTQQLLTLSKEGAPVMETSSMKDLLKRTVPFVLSGSNVMHVFDIEDDLSTVEIDKGQISQIITNLVINAQQAMPEGGNLYISASNVKVDESNPVATLKEGNYIKISISDEGIGIPDKIINRIFDPFFSTKSAGSGLGLANCYSIVRKHQGYITADSKVGEGTTFTFYLPASLEKVKKEKVSEKVEKLKGHVLVMDDQDSVREFMRSILEELGCEEEAVSNGKEAIEMYKKAKESNNPFDLLVFDLTIPGGMGAKETIKEIKSFDKNVKAIAYSGYANDPVMINPGKFGFKGAITKPFKIDKLSKLLKKLLS